MTRKLFSLSLLFCLVVAMAAQIPAGYYSSSTGKSGKSLKTALAAIIDNHTVRTYDQLKQDFFKTDLRSDGKIWDMYSDITNYTPGKDEGASAGGENIGGYNREHSFPKSWFDDAKPMYSDLFHIVPTDVYVNNRRSNYPFGENNGETWSSHNNFSKVGKCTTAGYSGTVFEPNDEYKGDFARIYFYMATRYEDKIASWSSPMLANNSYPAYAKWAIDMLLRWAAEDPVSEKEINRNNAIYGIQHNRNPYVDYPGLEQYVWGEKSTTAFDPDNYEGGGTVTPPDPETPAQPTFNPASGIVAPGASVTISTETEGAYIYYSINGAEETVQYPPVTLTIGDDTSISAYAMKGEKRSETVTAKYTVSSGSEETSGIYMLINSNDDLLTGRYYLVVCSYGDDTNPTTRAMAGNDNEIRQYADVDISNQTIQTETGTDGYPYAIRLGGSDNAWTLQDAVTNKYLALTSSKNKLVDLDNANETSAQWSITFSDDYARISPNAYPNRSIQYNASAPRFACYSTGQKPVMLFRQYNQSSGIDDIQKAESSYHVFDVNGRYIRTATTLKTALQNLPAGLYVVNGRKLLITTK